MRAGADRYTEISWKYFVSCISLSSPAQDKLSLGRNPHECVHNPSHNLDGLKLDAHNNNNNNNNQ